MLTFSSKSDATDFVAALKHSGKRVGVVLTMGYLHEGHMSLIHRAKAKADAVVVSIFVNPTQFGEAADLDAYPRDTDRDLAMLRAAGVDAVFLPTVDVMYPDGPDTVVDVPSLSGVLQGEVRPGHFAGVATVVTKLFNILQPDVTVFGEKDYQQLALIRKMVRDLDMQVQVVGAPIVREADGLAMSSRNVRLRAEDRAAATVLNHALNVAEAAEGTAEDLANLLHDTIAPQPRAYIKSIDIRDAAALAPVTGVRHRDVVALLAVQFGDVLLIDNRVISA